MSCLPSQGKNKIKLKYWNYIQLLMDEKRSMQANKIKAPEDYINIFGSYRQQTNMQNYKNDNIGILKLQ